MAIVPLKCPKCSAVIQLDEEQETSICQSCGSAFPFREAVQKYMGELAGKLKPDEDAPRSPTIFTTTTTTVNGKTTTVNSQDSNFDDIVTKFFGAQSGFQGLGSEPIPGYDLPENVVKMIRILVANGQKIQAIKVFRQFAKVDLKEAKDVIDQLEALSPDVGTGPQNMSNVNIKITGPDNMDTTTIPGYPLTNSGQKRKYKDPNVKVSKCYIATAVYGSYDAPQVLVLRKFRDDVLSKSLFGRVFIRTYYTMSPPVARRLENAGRMNFMVRRILDMVVRRLE